MTTFLFLASVLSFSVVSCFCSLSLFDLAPVHKRQFQVRLLTCADVVGGGDAAGEHVARLGCGLHVEEVHALGEGVSGL
jgi:hypothetical protein